MTIKKPSQVRQVRRVRRVRQVRQVRLEINPDGVSRWVINEVDVAEVQDDGQVWDLLVGQHDLVDAVSDVRRRRKRPVLRKINIGLCNEMIFCQNVTVFRNFVTHEL